VWRQFAGVLVSLWYVDWAGRRPLMVWGGVGCTAALLLLALGDAARNFGVILLAMCAFLFAFSASYGAPPPLFPMPYALYCTTNLCMLSFKLWKCGKSCHPVHLPWAPVGSDACERSAPAAAMSSLTLTRQEET
jgi:hypothetical protein